MRCPRCQHENPPGMRFCGDCGTPLRQLEGIAHSTSSYADLERFLTEARDQQTATAEILRVIGTSPTDAHPVFEAIACSGVQVCGALSCGVFVVDGEMLHLAATHGVPAARIERFRSQFPAPLTSPEDATRAVRERSIFHMADIENNPAATPAQIEVARLGGYCTRLMVPMLRGNNALGLIAVTSAAPTPFPERQVELLKTFADQAVIAIENVRLFKELQEKNYALTEAHAQVSDALEQQTATSEILRVISSSPTDVQPVFDTIVRSALRLCNGATAAVFRMDGGILHHPANYGGSPEALSAARARYPRPVGMDSIPGIAILTRSEYEVPDTEAPAALEMSRETGRILGIRSLFAVPILREDDAVGAIVVTRREPGGFAATDISLLKTFADQAVIAIENVRLFTELQASNRELTTALDTQTATSDILRVISQSQTDVQPVFDAIVRNAVRLCGALQGGVYRFDGELVHSVAHDGYTPEQLQQWRATWPKPVTAPSFACQAIKTRSPVRIRDFETAPELALHSPETVANLRARGSRSVLAVPMFRQNDVIGAISLAHREVDTFSDAHLELLKTFADQAVIAIENVRLFKELEARTAELTRSVGELTALSEISQVLSSTLDLGTVLTTIVSRAVELSGLDGGVVFEYDDGTAEFVHRAATETGGTLAEARRTTRVRRGEGMVGQTAITLEPAQVPDITEPGAYDSRLRGNLIESGVRAILAVPMVREGQLIGCLVVSRNRPGNFPAEAVELLRTFGTQSALAIQNARLFHEIADKSRQLEAASQHKSEFLANMSHELRTPLNAIIGFSEVLSEKMFGDVNDKQAEYLQDILESGRHLLSLINDILDLSKIEAGRMELELTDFSVPQAIQNAGILVRERALRRGIVLHEVIADGVGGIRGDERKVKQVLLNLLSNAIKFTPEGGRIEVRAASTDGMVEVFVTDSGVGIAPEDHEAVFEEFRQVGTADKRAEG